MKLVKKIKALFKRTPRPGDQRFKNGSIEVAVEGKPPEATAEKEVVIAKRKRQRKGQLPFWRVK